MIAFQFSLQYDSIFRQQVMGDANYENTKQALCSHMMILGTDTYFSFFLWGWGGGYGGDVISEKEVLYKFVKKFNAQNIGQFPCTRPLQKK